MERRCVCFEPHTHFGNDIHAPLAYVISGSKKESKYPFKQVASWHIIHGMRNLAIKGRAILLLMLVAPSLGFCEPLFVEVKSAALRKEPKHWAEAIEQLQYGDQLEEISRASSWVMVKTNGSRQGYVHLSALTKRVVLLPKAGAANPAIEADASSIVLAGKGFNKDIEAQYSAGQPSLNYAAVALMESREVSAQQLYQFLRDGKLLSEAGS